LIAFAKEAAFVDNVRLIVTSPQDTLPLSSHTINATPAASAAAPQGSLALIGGRFEPDNDALFTALRKHCNGRIAICSMASGFPQDVGEETVEEFREQGFYAELVPIFFETREESAFDPRLIERLQAFGSVFFTGGDQSRIVGTLVQDGEETPALAVIRALYAQGGLIAGSSAGAAIMSGPMILSGTSLHAVSRGLGPEDDPDAFRLGRGLGFFQWGMVDQHFLQRGRIGRLLKAAQLSGEQLAFGIDENSALIVQGDRGEVVGETGLLFMDLRKARFDEGDVVLSGARISYLDDGDAIDLRRGKPLPAADKRRTRVNRSSFRRPAPVRRNAFASYGLHDLMLRLVEADPAYYSHDSANAFDALYGNQVTLTIERRPHSSRALRAVREGSIRYTALNFSLHMRRATLDVCPLNESTQILHPDPSPESRLVLLGNSPVNWSADALTSLREQLREPVGVLATASGEPTAMAERYLDWLSKENIRGELLPITLHNIERASRDRALLRTIDGMGSLLLTGGDQRRLTETLLHCAEATPVLHAIVSAYERGTPLIAAAASASALGARMITEGDSVAALRYGSSEDASFSGVVVERGIGLTQFGLIDQNFVRRHRLGRLLMACAEQHQRFGFGLCEGSGLVIGGTGREIAAIGSAGVLVVELDLDRVKLAPGLPDPTGIRIYILEAGQSASLDNLAADTAERSAAGAALLDESLRDLADDYGRAASGARGDFDRQRWQTAAAVH
jgi:cyanophycinase